jgi:hypothetical protein
MCFIVSKNIANVYLQFNSTFVRKFIGHFVMVIVTYALHENICTYMKFKWNHFLGIYKNVII